MVLSPLLTILKNSTSYGQISKPKSRPRIVEAKAKATKFCPRAVLEVEASPRGPHPCVLSYSYRCQCECSTVERGPLTQSFATPLSACSGTCTCSGVGVGGRIGGIDPPPSSKSGGIIPHFSSKTACKNTLHRR